MTEENSIDRTLREEFRLKDVALLAQHLQARGAYPDSVELLAVRLLDSGEAEVCGATVSLKTDFQEIRDRHSRLFEQPAPETQPEPPAPEPEPEPQPPTFSEAYPHLVDDRGYPRNLAELMTFARKKQGGQV